MGKVKNGVNEVVRFGKALTGGVVGVLATLYLALFLVLFVLVVAAGALTIPAMGAILLAHFLSLSTGWAIAFFLALVWLLWC
ncbi:MAG: hypothetical protein J5965_22245 [Aeriscardovia sp.]|nr:hypothetical protein [Aeriscardovia sp.]